jgi:hypothetical protein
MKKTFSGFFLLVFIFAFISISHAQTVKTNEFKKPFIMVELNGGYSLPAMQLNGDFVGDIYNYSYYGTKLGFGLEVKSKLAVLTRPSSQLRTTLTLGYSQFSNDESHAFGIGVVQSGWPTNAPASINLPGVSNVRISIPHVAGGMEYAVYTDLAKRSSFNVGCDVNMSLITGRVYETPASTGVETFNTFSSSIRVGFGANVGYAYRFNKNFGFNVGTKFHFANLLGKNSEATTESGYIPLLDKADTSINPKLDVYRNIGFFNFFGGCTLYLGAR